MVKYDLHVHTQESDGAFTPTQIIDMACQTGLSGLAITDHDTIEGLSKAIKYIKENKIDISFVPGIELNTETQDTELHVLGYYIDLENQNMLERLKEIRDQRLERARLMVGKLQQMGFSIELTQVQNLAKGGLIGRPHIGMALVESGYINTIEESFVKYIGRGKPAYVDRYKFSTLEAIDMVKASGGIPVLAHPGLIGNMEKVHEVIEMGIEGLEVFYPQHDDIETKRYLDLCHGKKLLITGGSDFHGTSPSKGFENFGKYGLNEDEFLKIKNSYYNKK